MTLYQHYYIDRDYELLSLWQLLQETFAIQKALYPGCFVHIAPSFYLPEVVYVDSDRNAARFFRESTASEIIHQRRQGMLEPIFRFHPQSYTDPIPEPFYSFDLLISLYAGVISQPCKAYLKQSGYLLANNSHDDASIAFLDPDYTFIGALHQRKGQFTLDQNRLGSYFIPKNPEHFTIEWIHEKGKGAAFTRTAFLYLFQKTG
ncbi:MAG: hypothetical protein HPY85_00415 [Anaerolineae bacterium]|nr:hypothetical protein [Anaerolineae bacterium]